MSLYKATTTGASLYSIGVKGRERKKGLANWVDIRLAKPLVVCVCVCVCALRREWTLRLEVGVRRWVGYVWKG
jgi:hypothetical protein